MRHSSDEVQYNSHLKVTTTPWKQAELCLGISVFAAPLFSLKMLHNSNLRIVSVLIAQTCNVHLKSYAPLASVLSASRLCSML